MTDRGLLLNLKTTNYAAIAALPAKQHLSISLFGEVFFLLEQLIHGGFLSNAEACPCLYQAGQVVHLQLQLADHVLGPGFLQHDPCLSYPTAMLTLDVRQLTTQDSKIFHPRQLRGAWVYFEEFA